MHRIAHITSIILALTAQLQAQAFEEVTDRFGPRNAKFSTDLAWGDFDGDGLLDLFVTNTGTTSGLTPYNPLFHNLGDGSFEDVTDFTARNYVQRSGGNSTAAAWGDYDNDGDLDLYVTNLDEQDLLFQNRFVNFESRNIANSWIERIREEIGIEAKPPGASTAVAWGDYDNDGDLDLYVGKYYHANQLYSNTGNGLFTLSQELGLGDWRDTDDVTWIDYDNDGDLDLYVVNREQRNSLYRNASAGAAFTEVACALSMDNREIGRAAAWADYDNDGDPDLMLANLGANALYRNDGEDVFVDVAGQAGVRLEGDSWFTADAAWTDYNGDGLMDIYLTSGGDQQAQSDHLLANNGNGTFRDATADAGLPTAPAPHIAAAWADFNNDGAPDLYVANGVSQGDRLFLNTTPRDRFIKVQVRGKRERRGPDEGANYFGLGSWVRLVSSTDDEILASRQVQSRPEGFELIFGTPATVGPYKLIVTFPGNDQDVVLNRVEAGTAPVLVQEP